MSTTQQRPTVFETRLFINGEFVQAKKNATLDVFNPSTEEKFTQVSLASAEDVEAAIDAAQVAFPQWSCLPQKERSELLFRLSNLIERDLSDFAALEALDNGKPLKFALADIKDVITHLRYYAGWADKVTGKSFSSDPQSLYYTRREPFGVVGLISPWNFPLLMAEWKFGPALAAGNCVVMKPSEVTPLTVLKLAGLTKEAGFPKGVFNVVTGLGHIAGEAITRSDKINKVSFTGSSVIGRRILQVSSETNLKKIVLELGGKSPVVICSDADIYTAAEIAWWACMFNSGQSCDAGTRLFIHEDIHDEVLDKLVEISQTMVIGDAFDEGTTIGPLINKAQYDRVMQYITYAREVEKLTLLVGGERANEKGFFVKPTIYVNVSDDSKLAREEIFGPVLVSLKPWKTLDEVIKRANDTKYGLAAYIVTNNFGTVEKFTRQVKAGSFYVNSGATTPANMPFGGCKESGFGRDNGEEGLLEYTCVKSVYMNFPKPQ